METQLCENMIQNENLGCKGLLCLGIEDQRQSRNYREAESNSYQQILL